MTKLKPNLQSKSLETQLQRQLFWGLSFVLLIVLMVVHFTVQQLSIKFVASRLQHDAESLLTALVIAPDTTWTIDESKLNSVYLRAYSGHYYVVTINDTTLRSRSLWDINLPQSATQRDPKLKSTTKHLDGPSAQEWVTLKTYFTIGKTVTTVWLAEDIKPLQILQFKFEVGVLLLFIVSVPCLLYLQRKIIRRNFTTFDQLHNAINAFQQGDALVFPEQVPDEVRDLVGVIERTLLRSEKQVARSRTTVANLAHELKRPLQNLRWHAEHSNQTQASDLQAIYEQLQNLVVRELRRAAISGSLSIGKQFTPKADLPVLKTLLERQYRQSKKLHFDLPEGSLPFDRDDMLELIGNLLDNAWRYSNDTVRLSIHTDSSNDWIISVEDDGIGLTLQECALYAQRGVTKDEVSDQHQGLGLHICQAVVDSYEGSLVLTKSKLGGLNVLIRLPNSGSV